MLFFTKFLLGTDRIETDSEDFYVFALKVSVSVAQTASLGSASRSHRLRIKVDQRDSTSAGFGQVHQVSILILSRHGGNRVPNLEFAVGPPNGECPDGHDQTGQQKERYENEFHGQYHNRYPPTVQRSRSADRIGGRRKLYANVSSLGFNDRKRPTQRLQHPENH